MFRIARDNSGPFHAPAGRRRYVLEVNGGVLGGRLQTTWVYSRNLHRRVTVEHLADDFQESLRQLIRDGRARRAELPLPVDVSRIPLSLQQMDLLAEMLGDEEL